MASIRIRNKAESGGIPGLTKGELAVNLADAVLWVGGTTDTPIYLSGVQTFNGLTGAVGGVCGSVANTFSALQSFNAGVCAYGATFSNFIVCKQGIYLSPGGINFMDGSGNVQTESSLWQPGGDKSIAVGRGAIAGGLFLSNTENNVAVGYFAGAYYGSGYAPALLTGASGSIFIGADTRANANNEVNQIVIGTSSIGDGSNTTVIGNSQITSTRVYGLLSTNGGVSAAGATFGGLVSALAGVSASGATLGTLVVNGGLSAAGGITLNGSVSVKNGLSASSIYATSITSPTISVSDVLAASSIIAVGSLIANGISADGGITFNSLSHFTQGLSGSGATLGTLVVNSGISASGGVTFHNNVFVGGLLTANGGISAAGGVTFANTVYIGSTLSIAGDLTVVDESGSYAAEFVRSVGTTSDLPTTGKYAGQLYWVRGPVSGTITNNHSGYYFWDDWVPSLDGTTYSAWVRLTNARNYQAGDLDFDGDIDGNDLGSILAAWGSQGYCGGNYTLAATNGTSAAFEIKIFGVTTGKKAHPFTITSDVTDPQIYMAGEFVDIDGKLVVGNAPNQPAIEIPEGKGYAYFSNGMQVYGGATVGGNFIVSGMLSVTGGVSAAGGITFNGPVYMGATLTMNSNIRFNSGFGITGGFVDAGWY